MTRYIKAACVMLLAFAALAGTAEAASPAWKVIGVTGPTHFEPPDGGPSAGELVVRLANIGGAASSGEISVTVGPLPSGLSNSGAGTGAGWACSGPEPGETTVICTSSTAVATGTETSPIQMPVAVDSAVADGSVVPISVQGGGAVISPENDNFQIPIVVSSTPVQHGMRVVWADAVDEDGRSFTQAGGHPAGAAAFFQLNTFRLPNGHIAPVGDARDVDVEVPPGFVGNPLVTPRCPQSNRMGNLFGTAACPLAASVGLVTPGLFSFPGAGAINPLYNDIPALGYPAQFTFPYVTAESTLLANLRSDEDYGVTVRAARIPLLVKLWGAFSMLAGTPQGSGGKAFLTNPTRCSGQPDVTGFALNTWQVPSEFNGRDHELSVIAGCDQLTFEPSFGFQPDTGSPAAPAGATAELSVPQEDLLDPAELAQPHLKRSVVTLPEGLKLNPSAANGLQACSTEQIGLLGTNFADPNPIRFDKSDPACPDASKIGTFELETPLLDQALSGTVYLAAQGDNPFGSLIALYLVVDDDRFGIHVKLPGRVDLDPDTGRVTATFDHNPQVPFSSLKLQFRGGSRATLATPDVCGDYSTGGVWTPWSAPDSGPPTQTADSFSVSGAGCPSAKAGRPFGLGFDAGTTSRAGGSFAPFTMRLTRPDGSQELDRVEARTPLGLLASLRGIPYCSEAAIAQAGRRTADGDGAVEQASPSCPAASQIGTTSVGAGVGSTPYYAGGKVYLAGPYKGAPLSMVVVVPAVAGPFDLGVQVVRVALHVDRSTAQVTASSDEIPKILQGVPLQIQDVRVQLDRPGFTLNPTSCAAKQVAATVAGASGATAALAEPFQALGCAALPFKPKLKLALTGKKQVKTGKHPGIKAKVTQTGIGEAGIEKAVVRLPKSLALDPDNAQALCEFADGTKDDLENHCPKGSIVGRARAVSPLLNDPLVGNVYFVKNIRIDKKTGNQIRTLPMIIVALRGQIAINLKGESSTTKSGKLVNTFDNVPDAPINKFNLNIKGGKSGILAVTRTRKGKINLCAGRHVAEADMDGQNGRRHDRDIRLKTPCSKKQTKRAKRAAAKAKRAAKARRG